ncbi:MAG TPA: hypothetical protein H9726_02065, partial [Candidatus Borkfalkia avicola]|nr:hypothetical protein [Candidatus Borkfalkia avicola]
GNRIMAGNLDITATVAEQTADGAEVSYEVGGETYGFGAAAELTGQAIINEEGWQPGDRNAKLLTVSNAEANLAAVIKLDFVITDNGLTDALWFDFVRVEEGAVTGTLTERPMDTLETFAADLEFTLEAGDDISFILFYGMKEEAGNTYQGESFGVDAYILARQAAEGSEYDEAVARVATAEDLAAAVAEGKTAVLTEDVTVDTIPVNEEGDTAIVLGGNTLTTNQTGSITAASGKTISISDGTIIANGTDGSGTASILYAEAGGKIELTGVTLETNGTGVLAEGQDATVEVRNSHITALGFCVSSNARNESTHGINIRIENSVLESEHVNGYCGSAVMMNVPGTLYIEDSIIIGENNAVLARGGDITIVDSELSRPYAVEGPDESSYYMNKDWGDGNLVPMATLLVGNRSNSYQYPANVALENCTITASTDGAKTVYIYGNAAEENGATLTYDAATVIAPADKTVDPVIVGGGWVELDVSVTPDTAQAALDAITSDVDRAAVRLSSGSYGQLELSQTKYSQYVPDEGASTSSLYRTIRFGVLSDNSSVTVNGNKMINTGDAEGQLIKAQSVGTGTTVNLDGNYWSGRELSAAIDISLGATDNSPITSLS